VVKLLKKCQVRLQVGHTVFSLLQAVTMRNADLSVSINTDKLKVKILRFIFSVGTIIFTLSHSLTLLLQCALTYVGDHRLKTCNNNVNEDYCFANRRNHSLSFLLITNLTHFFLCIYLFPFSTRFEQPSAHRQENRIVSVHHLVYITLCR
jgi:hypothetical protein